MLGMCTLYHAATTWKQPQNRKNLPLRALVSAMSSVTSPKYLTKIPVFSLIQSIFRLFVGLFSILVLVRIEEWCRIDETSSFESWLLELAQCFLAIVFVIILFGSSPSFCIRSVEAEPCIRMRLSTYFWGLLLLICKGTDKWCWEINGKSKWGPNVPWRFENPRFFSCLCIS